MNFRITPAGVSQNLRAVSHASSTVQRLESKAKLPMPQTGKASLYPSPANHSQRLTGMRAEGKHLGCDSDPRTSSDCSTRWIEEINCRSNAKCGRGTLRRTSPATIPAAVPRAPWGDIAKHALRNQTGREGEGSERKTAFLMTV